MKTKITEAYVKAKEVARQRLGEVGEWQDETEPSLRL